MEQKIQPKSRKKIITIVIFLIIFIALAYWAGTQVNEWWKIRKEYVRMGLAKDKFPFRMYTAEELAEQGLYPESLPSYDAIPTRTTPEETYAKFRQALIDGNLDTAVECFIKEKREEYREALIKKKKEGKIPELLKQLTEIHPRGKQITKDYKGVSITTYEFFIIENGKKISHPINFSKDSNGDWKMENL